MTLLEEIKNIKSSPRDIRNFGLVMGFMCVFLTWYLFYAHKTFYPVLLILGPIFAIAGACSLSALKPFQKIWMIFGMLMGWIVMHIFLFIFFYIFLTPLAFIARLLGNSFLPVDFDKGTQSYWVLRSEEERAEDRTKEDLEKQF